MALNRKQTRYAHSEGHTDVCYSQDGNHIITCGNDGDLRIWSGLEDDEPESYCVGEAAFSVVQKNNFIYVCTDNGRIQILKYPEGDREGILTRFTACGAHVTVAKNKEILACASEDFNVKVFKLPNDPNPVNLTPLEGPALAVAITPNAKILAVSSGDGKIYIWNLEDNSLIHKIDVVPYSNNFTSAKILCKTSFSSNSQYLAYPHHKDVKIVSVESLGSVITSLTADVKSSFSIVQFSPCGKYLAASTSQGEICVWLIKSHKIIGISEHANKFNISSLAWNPKGNGEIVYVDVNGQLGTIENCKLTEEDSKLESTENNQVTGKESEEQNVFDNVLSDDEDGENVISLEKLRNETLHPETAESVFNEDSNEAPSPEPVAIPKLNLQAPFQPGSTPSHLEQRFLVYNEVGTVILYNDDDPNINCEFHDATHHRSIYMKNHAGYTMASLSSTVLALACETPSKLVCIPLNSNSKEWSVTMTGIEEIICVAASSMLVAVATDTRMLRVFSVLGTQRALISIPGPVVALTAIDGSIAAVYHSHTTYSKDQMLAAMLVCINGMEQQCKYFPVTLSPEASLRWFGFSERGSLITYDSCGIARMFVPTSALWIPICDGNNHVSGVSDNFFVTHISEASQMLRVIHCRGSLYPPVIPRPIPKEIPFQIPLCEMDTEKSQYEDRLLRWSHFQVDQPAKAHKEIAIKLFALACRSEEDSRALELMETLASGELIDIAIKYSSKLNRGRLVDKLMKLLNQLQEIEKEEAEDQNEPSSQTLSLRTEEIPIKNSAKPQCTQNNSFLLNSQESIINGDETLKPKPLTFKNPFTKKQSANEKRNLLSLTNANEEPATKVTLPAATEISSSAIKPTISGESFLEWYSKQKSDLEKKHPDLSAKDLMKIAMNIYKEKGKRKASDEGENNSNAKQSKLSTFAFSKN